MSKSAQIALVVFVLILMVVSFFSVVQVSQLRLDKTQLQKEIEAYKNDIVLLEQARDSWRAKAEATPKIDTNQELLKQIIQSTKSADLSIHMDTVNGTTGNLTIHFENR